MPCAKEVIRLLTLLTISSDSPPMDSSTRKLETISVCSLACAMRYRRSSTESRVNSRDRVSRLMASIISWASATADCPAFSSTGDTLDTAGEAAAAADTASSRVDAAAFASSSSRAIATYSSRRRNSSNKLASVTRFAFNISCMRPAAGIICSAGVP